MSFFNNRYSPMFRKGCLVGLVPFLASPAFLVVVTVLILRFFSVPLGEALAKSYSNMQLWDFLKGVFFGVLLWILILAVWMLGLVG